MRVKTIKLLEDYKRRYLHYVGIGKVFLKTQNAITVKENNDKFDPMRIKNICILQDTIKKVKMQKIFGTHKHQRTYPAYENNFLKL